MLLKNYSKSEVISQNRRTILLKDRDYFIKIFKCEGESRSRKEINFYDKYAGKYTPELVSHSCIDGFYILKFRFLKGFHPGFISDKEIGFVSAENFQKIRETIIDIQKGCTNGILVHNDMAPHNIYLSGGKVIVGDWDSYRIYKDNSYRMHDYATLWAWLYYNEDHLIEVYSHHEFPKMCANGSLESFQISFLRRLDEMKKHSGNFLARGTKLRKTILQSFEEPSAAV